MKSIFKNVLLFMVFSFVFSAMTGCEGSGSASGNSANANSSTAARSAYPMMASHLANADFELMDGTKIKSVDKKGKVVVLNLWAIWCGPCREEMPHLVELQNTYGEQGLEIIGLNVGDHDGRFEPIPNITKFGESMKLNYTLARIPISLAAQFYKVSGQNAVPQTFIIDREGRMRGASVGGGPAKIKELKDTVRKVMAEG